MKRIVRIAGLVMFLLLGAPALVLAEPAISKSDAANIATSVYPGKVINIGLSDSDKNPVYRVKVLDNKGGMHIVTIDGNSGQIISAH